MGRDHVKTFYNKRPKEIEPNVGMEFPLITTIYHWMIKTLGYLGKDSDKPRVMLILPTGVVVALYIGRTAIHSALEIPIGKFSNTALKLGTKFNLLFETNILSLTLGFLGLLDSGGRGTMCPHSNF